MAGEVPCGTRPRSTSSWALSARPSAVALVGRCFCLGSFFQSNAMLFPFLLVCVSSLRVLGCLWNGCAHGSHASRPPGFVGCLTASWGAGGGEVRGSCREGHRAPSRAVLEEVTGRTRRRAPPTTRLFLGQLRHLPAPLPRLCVTL